MLYVQAQETVERAGIEASDLQSGVDRKTAKQGRADSSSFPSFPSIPCKRPSMNPYRDERKSIFTVASGVWDSVVQRGTGWYKTQVAPG